jgi:hypothetical protein
MIWVSRGRGGWAIWTLILLIMVPLLAGDQFHLLPQTQHAAQWILLGGLLASGLIVTALGFRLNRGPGRWTIDSASGLQYFDKSAKHSLYLIPMQYWGLFYCTLAITIIALKH